MENKFTEKQEQWLQLLESGKYKQGTLRLRKGDAYCCLGVFEEFVACRTAVGQDPVPHNSAFELFEFEGSSTCARDYNLIDLRSGNGDISDLNGFFQAIKSLGYTGQLAKTLSGYNDYGATFAQIAGAIRKCPDAAFINFNE